MDLKQRKDLKNYMHRIGCDASTIKRAAHAFEVGEDNHLQMQEMVILVEKAKGLMDTLKPVQPDDSRQGILLPLEGMEPVAGKIIYTPNGTEPSMEDKEE